MSPKPKSEAKKPKTIGIVFAKASSNILVSSKNQIRLSNN